MSNPPDENGSADRISLSLPAGPEAVAQAAAAAGGLAGRGDFSPAGEAAIVSATERAVSAALDRARPGDRLRVHYDVTDGEVALTVERRRRMPLRRSPAAGVRVVIAADGRLREDRSRATSPLGQNRNA